MTRRRDFLRSVPVLAAKPWEAVATGAASAPVARPPLPLGEISVVGMRYYDKEGRLARLVSGEVLRLVREPTHTRDPWAVAVCAADGKRLGYLPRGDNRQVAGLLDAGAQIEAVVPDGYPYEASPENWRMAVRLSLTGAEAPPSPGEAERDQVAYLLRAEPLMAEWFTGPGYGARAVMLAGPCAGWQRTREAEWVPPGALPWPSPDRIAREFRLRGDEVARVETARALRAAAEAGRPVPPITPANTPSLPPPATPSERARLLLRGWLDAPGRSEAEAAPHVGALDHLSLKRAPDHRRGALTVLVLDRDRRRVGRLPSAQGEMVARLIDEGYALDIVARDPGPQPRSNGGLRVPFEIRLRGAEPPDVAARRGDAQRLLADMLPLEVDAERLCAALKTRALDQLLQQASLASHRKGGRLTEEELRNLMAEVEKAIGGA